MVVRLRTVFFFILGVLLLWFFYMERSILTPFVLGAIFAYIFNPTVNLFTRKIKLPRAVSVLIVFLILISLVVGVSIILTQIIVNESDDIRKYINLLLHTTNSQLNTLPSWLQPTARDLLLSIKKYQGKNAISLISYFPQAVSKIVGFLIFVFSSFYFLKEGHLFIDRFLRIFPRDLKVEVEILLRKINSVLGGYLRGQLFLVFLMALGLYLSLTILGIRFALTIAIFSGLAEIVPLVGPIVATIVATSVAMITGANHFGLQPVQLGVVIVILYFVLRHLEDYFVIPLVMGKITKLHPFVIFFAVIAGGHIGGVLGLILAVPIAAIGKILLEFCFDYLHTKKDSLDVPGSE